MGRGESAQYELPKVNAIQKHALCNDTMKSNLETLEDQTSYLVLL